MPAETSNTRTGNGDVVIDPAAVTEPSQNNHNNLADDGDDVVEAVPAAPAVPDGGWGWVVVFGSFMIHVIADGIAYSFGVYVENFVDYFECTKSAVGGLGSLMLGVTWGSGPIASALTNKFGCRITAVAGSIIASFGMVISMWAPSIWFMYFSLGCVTGLGLGMAYLPAIVAVSFYFEKRRSLATGLAVCGSGIGTFAFAPLTDKLLELYSWKGTLLIEAGILLNCVLCGMVFRPFKLPTKQGAPEGEVPAGQNEATVAVAERPTEKSKTASLGVLPTTSADADAAAARKRQFSETQASSTQLAGPMARKDVFYTKSLDNIPRYRADRNEYIHSMTSLKGQPDPEPDKSCLAKIGITKEMRQTFNEMMDFRLLLDVAFILFAISNLLTSIGFAVPYIFLPNRGIRLGFESDKASLLISMVGISNTLGRIVFGFIADLQCTNKLMLYNTVLVLCGICSVISVLLTTYPLLMCYSFSFGFFIGVYVCLTPIVLVDLLGLERLSNAFGLVLLFQGIGAVAGPPFAGWLFDISDTYDYSFYMMGICVIISGAMLYPIPFIRRWQERRGTKPQTEGPRTTQEEEQVALNAMNA